MPKTVRVRFACNSQSTHAVTHPLSALQSICMMRARRSSVTGLVERD
jgi:hypothetical protein